MARASGRSEEQGPVPVVVVGLDETGRQMARAALHAGEVELAGVVGVSDDPYGRRLSEVLGEPAGSLVVKRSLPEALKSVSGGVVLMSHGPRLESAVEDILAGLRHGAHVVSTCAELAFPYLDHPELGDRIDRAASKAGRAVLGVSVNPGLVMDRLPAVVGQAAGAVRGVSVRRVVDLSTAPPSLRALAGLGLDEDTFFTALEEDRVGHVGLLQSVALCALGLGVECDDFEEEVLPLFAEEAEPGVVQTGQVAGIRQVAIGVSDDLQKVRLELVLQWKAEPLDELEIDATHRIHIRIPGGIPDTGTAHLAVNAAPRVSQAEPGLLTVLDLPAGR